MWVTRLCPEPGSASASARLDLVSGHRLPTGVDGVLLMAETLVLAGPTAHVGIDGVHEPVVLFRHKDGIGLRHGPAVRVNTVCPGFIQTRWLLGGMGEANYNKMKEMQEQTTPLRQAGTTAQMAEAALFFLTSASNITGEFLIVDAGTHLGGLPMKGR